MIDLLCLWTGHGPCPTPRTCNKSRRNARSWRSLSLDWCRPRPGAASKSTRTLISAAQTLWSCHSMNGWLHRKYELSPARIFHRENISKYLQVVRVGNYFNLQCEHIENGIPWLPSGTRVQDECQQHLGSKAQSLQAQDSFLILEWGRRWTGLRHRDSWWRVSSKLWWVVGVW